MKTARGHAWDMLLPFVNCSIDEALDHVATQTRTNVQLT